MLDVIARTGHSKHTLRVTYLLWGGYDSRDNVMNCGIVMYSVMYNLVM